MPVSEAQCVACLENLNNRIAEGTAKMAQLAEERAGSEKLRERVTALLTRWFIHGAPENPS